MIVGLDMGASATKIVGINKDQILFTRSEGTVSRDVEKLLLVTVQRCGFSAEDITAVAVTGVGAEKCNIKRSLAPVKFVSEIDATGEGGSWLSGKANCVVVSIGTGTSLVLAREGRFMHIGGSGVGSGTLRGLAKKFYGTAELPKMFSLAKTGNRLNVDITIADLFSGTDTLPLDLTASNLAKCSDAATDADWAHAIINTVLEVAGSHAALACGGYGVKNVVITGGVSQTGIAKAVYDNFARLYKLNYIIPEYSDFATAIGAARRVYLGA